MSWDEQFASRYDEWSAGMTEDVSFYVSLAADSHGPLVELAVGGGRVAIPVALATGKTVIGIDSSPAMLAQARTAAAAAGVSLDLREGDVRDLELDEPAGLIYCPFRALLHLRTWADRRRVFERVADSLRVGGRFAWNAFAFDHAIAAAYEERGPNKIADYAFGLAQTFSSYYNQLHILSEQDKALLQSRLALCAVTLRTLELSLSLLGIEVPERM